MSVWFEGQSSIDCQIGDVKSAMDDLGQLFVSVVSLMPGMSSVELVAQSNDTVTIATNEGSMKRTNISKQVEEEGVLLEFDEEYEAALKVTVTSHHRHEFEPDDRGVNHRMVIDNVEATGLLGFFYRVFAKSNMGNAFLTAYKTHFEAPPA